MFLVTVCSSLARRVRCEASCFALICCLGSSSFFFLSFASFLILLNLACRVDLIFLALLIFSFFALVLVNFPFPHFLGLCNKINDYAAIGLLFFI